MLKRARGAMLGLAFLAQVGAAAGADPVKIGFVTTLSGPGGYLGQDIRDAFQLAIDLEGGKLGGVPVQVVVEDDGLKPGQAKGIVDRFLKRDKMRLITGVVFSNVASAIAPDVLDEGAIFVSPNAGPANFAGAECHKNYFVVSWITDTMQGSAGKLATELGYERAFVLAPNYQAGKEAIEGFKRFYKGKIIGEIYTRLDQVDFAPEMAQIRDAKPDVVFQFHPGGLGIAFMRQYKQAGVNIPMVVAAPSLDERTLEAVGDAVEGFNVAGHWNIDFDNAANRRFVAEFGKAYGRKPTMYASQGYDTALAIGAALKATAGKLDDTEAFRAAMLKADFPSVRGSFKFGPNQHPIQDWWALRVARGPDGKLAIKTDRKIMSEYGDAYATACKL